MKVKVDEMINSIEVVKRGRITALTLFDGTRTEKYVFPFDSTPPSMIVVSRKDLADRFTVQQVLITLKDETIKKQEAQIDEKNAEIVQYQHEAELLTKSINGTAAEYKALKDALLVPPDENLPLTFEQLKGRVGRPVWRKQVNEKNGEWVIFTGTRETHEGGEALQEISYAPGYADDYVLLNPSLVEYYDQTTEKGI